MSDAESLEIKKRARRRLVGAVALALLAAVLLPLMMEQEPHSGSGDIQISIPPRPGLPVASQPEVPPPLPPAGEDGGPGELADPVTSQPGKSATESTPAAPKPPPLVATPAAPVDAPATEQAAAREAARALAAIEGNASAAPRADSFVLQIGAFADADKASRLVAELKNRGFPAYTEQAGKVTRVRIGPLKGRALTDKTAAELALLGYSTVSSPL